MSPKYRNDAPPAETRLSGSIIKWLPDKGFGFIQAEGKEYFFHRSAVQNPDAVTIGQAVTFVSKAAPKGPRAEEVEFQD